MKLFGESGTYPMDPWDWVDFIVVFVGHALEFSSLCEPPLTMHSFILCNIVAAVSDIPNVSGLRFFNAVPGIKKLVTALLKSIPELLTVVALLSFLFFLYGVIGVQLWSGAMHSRCRLTPYAMYLDPNPRAAPGRRRNSQVSCRIECCM